MFISVVPTVDRSDAAAVDTAQLGVSGSHANRKEFTGGDLVTVAAAAGAESLRGIGFAARAQQRVL